MTEQVVKLFEGDKRLENLCKELEEVVYTRGQGLPIPSIIGVLELIKMNICEVLE